MDPNRIALGRAGGTNLAPSSAGAFRGATTAASGQATGSLVRPLGLSSSSDPDRIFREVMGPATAPPEIRSPLAARVTEMVQVKVQDQKGGSTTATLPPL